MRARAQRLTVVVMRRDDENRIVVVAANHFDDERRVPTRKTRGRRPPLAVVLAFVATCLLASAPPSGAQAVPPNDEREGATAFASLPFTDALDTRSATSSAEDGACVGAEATVWYRFVNAEARWVSISTAGSSY